MDLGALGQNLSDLEAFVWEGLSALDVLMLFFKQWLYWYPVEIWLLEASTSSMMLG